MCCLIQILYSLSLFRKILRDWLDINYCIHLSVINNQKDIFTIGYLGHIPLWSITKWNHVQSSNMMVMSAHDWLTLRCADVIYNSHKKQCLCIIFLKKKAAYIFNYFWDHFVFKKLLPSLGQKSQKMIFLKWYQILSKQRHVPKKYQF